MPETMTEHPYDLLVFSDDWDRHPSSAQHLVARLARRHRVLWVNTLGLRAAKADRFTAGRAAEKLRQWTHPLRQVGERFFVYSPIMLPLAGGVGGRCNSRLATLGIRRAMDRAHLRRPVMLTSVPTAADYLDGLDTRALVYYITDDYRHWPGANAAHIAAQDDLLTRRADLLLPCSDALAVGRPARTPTELLPHAVDVDHFARVDEPLPAPAELTGIGHPRLCFFGLIYEKVDVELLTRLAKGEPDKELVLIGPVKTDISALSALPNVHVLGPRPYAELPRYLKCVDVLLLPYVLDEQIRRSAPLKIRECLAVGKPIVAVDVPDLRRYAGLIRLAGDTGSFLAACRGACRDRDTRPEPMRAAVAADTWTARAEQFERAVAGVLAGGRTGGRAVRTRVEIGTDGRAWDAYIGGHPDGTVWHRWAFSTAMRSAYGMSCPFLLARRGGRIVGALPLALQASRAFGRRLVSLPWLDHAGILADDPMAAEALLGRATALAERNGAQLLLRERAPRADWPARTDKVVMTLDLPVGGDALWASFKPKVRNQIRKARRSGLSAEWVGAEGVGDFYAVYSMNMRDLGSPPHSLAFFRCVLAELPDLARLLHVRLAGRTVAAALVLTDEAAWQVPWASSRREVNRLCPSHLMYWHILQAACGQTRQFCFGRSTRDSGTCKFKAQWGARPSQLYWHSPSGEARPAGAASPGRLMGLAQRLWQRVPASLARTLGPHVIKSVG